MLINGAYGKRIAHIARTLGIAVWELDWDENQQVDPSSVEEALAEHSEITHVAMVHCETTTGIMNPLAEVAEVVRKHKRAFILDAMSSFGAWPIDVNATPVDFLVSSANKAIEGVPGFSFVVFRKGALDAAGGVGGGGGWFDGDSISSAASSGGIAGSRFSGAAVAGAMSAPGASQPEPMHSSS